MAVHAAHPLAKPLAVYQQTDLVSNSSAPFKNLTPQSVDTNLINPWGLVAGPGPTAPFWISDQGTAVSTLDSVSTTGTVTKQGLVVSIPGGSPTGIVFNASTTDFMIPGPSGSVPAAFIFSTLTGNIDAWNPKSNGGLGSAVVAASSPGAHYTGLALASSDGQNLLYAANEAATPGIDVYNSSFTKVSLAGNFVDPKLKAGFTPYNVVSIDNQIVVTYRGPGKGGAIAEFNTDGTFVRQLASNGKKGKLQAPWGVTMAPSDFGKFSNDFLVGNFLNGRINAYNPATGRLAGQLSNPHGKPIAIPGLWALEFGNNQSAGASNALFFTAGIGNQSGGLLGMLQATPRSKPAVTPSMGGGFMY
jgi:uncharacterized protein (TIGR03118 family)